MWSARGRRAVGEVDAGDDEGGADGEVLRGPVVHGDPPHLLRRQLSLPVNHSVVATFPYTKTDIQKSRHNAFLLIQLFNVRSRS